MTTHSKRGCIENGVNQSPGETLMSNQFNMPTYEEIVALSNGELTKRISEIEQAINATRESGESTSQGTRVYKVYEEEWVKRMYLLGGRKKNNLNH